MSKVVIGSFRKQPRERLDYYVNYESWLSDGETILSSTLEVTPVTDPPLGLSDVFTTDNITIGFVVEGGVSGTSYKVTVLANTSDTLVVEREINYVVEEF